MTRRGAVVAALAPGRAGAAADPMLVGAGWRFAGVPGQAPARFGLTEGVIAIRAEAAVGFLLRPIAATEVPDGGWRLAWRWRVEAAPPATDPADAGADDRPAAVHVLFAGAGGNWRGWLRGWALGAAFSGRVVTYMWGGTAPAGTRLRNPHVAGDGVLVVRRDATAPLGVWVDERVDPLGDYRSAFGGVAPAPTHLALSADTDDRGGASLAWIAPPVLVPA